MKVKIIDLQKQNKGEKELPIQFSEPFRPDLIKRAVVSLESKERQKYGADPEAGKRHSAELSKRRRKYRGSYGFGISRVTRKILSRRGTRFHWVGAVSPGTVGGRKAHPPKSEKKWENQINKNENKKALRSALSATMNKEIVAKRGHQIPPEYPFIITSEIEKINTTKEVKEILKKIDFDAELERSVKKTIRAGKGKLRGRKYLKKKGILIVVGESCPLIKSARNIPGTDIVLPNQLNSKLLAPGSEPGRITLFTENAIKQIEEKKLFI